MAVDKRAYVEGLLIALNTRLSEIEADKEKYETLTEQWDLQREEMLIHIEAVQEFLDDLP